MIIHKTIILLKELCKWFFCWADEKPQIQFSDKPFLSKNSFITSLEFEPTKLYQMLKKNKVRSEVFSVQLSRRLLRTRKTLVLPAHVNITAITNSYDIVHS